MAALGFLTAADSSAIPESEVRDMAQAAAILSESAASAPPSASLKDRLMSRIGAFETIRPIADIRPYDGAWIDTGVPGVDMKRLFRDRQTGRTTLLLRMAPGAHFPAHHHGDDEQCWVIKGDVRFGDLVYEEGDFVVMGKNSTHPEIHSANGNVLLLIAGHNEFMK